MISENQAELARLATKSTLCTAVINFEIQDASEKTRNEICIDIDRILKEHYTSFDKAFPLILGEFTAAAKRSNLDPASIYCIYAVNKINLA